MPRIVDLSQKIGRNEDNLGSAYKSLRTQDVIFAVLKYCSSKNCTENDIHLLVPFVHNKYKKLVDSSVLSWLGVSDASELASFFKVYAKKMSEKNFTFGFHPNVLHHATILGHQRCLIDAALG